MKKIFASEWESMKPKRLRQFMERKAVVGDDNGNPSRMGGR